MTTAIFPQSRLEHPSIDLSRVWNFWIRPRSYLELSSIEFNIKALPGMHLTLLEFACYPRVSINLDQSSAFDLQTRWIPPFVLWEILKHGSSQVEQRAPCSDHQPLKVAIHLLMTWKREDTWQCLAEKRASSILELGINRIIRPLFDHVYWYKW